MGIFFPVVLSFALVFTPLLLLRRSKMAAAASAMVSLAILMSITLWQFVPGWKLARRARAGDAESAYQYARWLETHVTQLRRFIVWPFGTKTMAAYSWIEKAAAQGYPPAIYAQGWRLKYGIGVPRPTEWTGPEGNVFPNPDRGQQLIDVSLRLGFVPPVPENEFLVWWTRSGARFR